MASTRGEDGKVASKTGKEATPLNAAPADTEYLQGTNAFSLWDTFLFNVDFKDAANHKYLAGNHMYVNMS